MDQQLPIYLAVVLGGVLACIPMVIIKKPKPRNREKFTLVSMVRFWVGISALILAIPFIMGGMLSLNVAEIFRLAATSTAEQAAKQMQEQKADFLVSNGWAFIAVGIGLVFTSAQVLLDAVDRRKS